MTKKGHCVDRKGERYGRLVALSCEVKMTKYGQTRAYWTCKCDCGKVVEVPAVNLCRKRLKSASCGCKRLEGRKKDRSPIYDRLVRLYRGMVKRCNDPKESSFSRYGGRGITVAEDWLLPGQEGFYNFYMWAVNNEYDVSKSLDRVNNDGPYAANNCRWANIKEQARNKRNTVIVVYKGESYPLTALCEELGAAVDLVRGRLKSGWNLDRALTVPTLQSGTRKHKTYNRLRGIYNGFIQRCYVSKTRAYKSYGGRGIAVCEDWRRSFEVFRSWALNNGYTETLSLERIDVNGNYCPENCKWIPKADQAKNTRRTVYVTYEGSQISTLNLYALKSPPCNYRAFMQRIRQGWDLNRALSQPQQGVVFS